MLNNMNDQEILDTKLEELACILLKKFEKEPNIKIAQGILDYFQDRNIKVRRAVEETIQWLCNNALIAPRVINGYYTESHFITRKGLKKLKEKKHE